MKGSTKMENYDGYLNRFTTIHKTKILPLRWFANLCERPAHYHLNIYLNYSDQDYHGFAFKVHAYLSNMFYKPYLKWGTVYQFNLTNTERNPK